FFIAEDTMNYELLDDDEEEHLTIFGYGMPTLAFQEDIERAFGVLQSRVDPSRGDLSEREAFVAAHHNWQLAATQYWILALLFLFLSCMNKFAEILQKHDRHIQFRHKNRQTHSLDSTCVEGVGIDQG
ncbi:hypothetical protein ACJX0J_020165, partial [Zea mays]